MSVENEVTMSDDAISAIAKLLQVAILTGTDVIDNLRTVRVVADSDNSVVSLDEDYKAQSQKNIESLLQEAETLSSQE